MRTASDVRKVMPQEFPPTVVDVKPKIKSMLTSEEYITYVNKYLDKKIDMSIERNKELIQTYGNQNYPFVILEKYIDYKFLANYLVMELNLSVEERDAFVKFNLAGYTLQKVKKLVKHLMIRERGFSFLEDKTQYYNLYDEIETRQEYLYSEACFYIENNSINKKTVLLKELTLVMIAELVIIAISQFEAWGLGFVPIVAAPLAIIILIVEDRKKLKKIRKQEQRLILLENEEKYEKS
ncbi:hypothetical protein [Lactobacillus johnsonii]|uniref:Uncharacterized protein n=1 Tax=Lactobacillus johnsonii TaxID=33959 RepID=A0A9X7XVH1_LACJH|nr:hypothetical protein [Lactobacillus johnsonii]QIA88503.1 hypothetical protein FEE39_09655 [Lactobacillus johnsonii]